MNDFHSWLHHKEAIWLFYVLIGELLVSLASFIVLIFEYRYDASKDAQEYFRTMNNRRKRKYNFENLTTGEMK